MTKTSAAASTWNGSAPKGSVPLTGGTLLVAGVTAVAADPDRDVVSIVDLGKAQILGQIELPSGSEPGRLVQDSTGIVHVILRRGGGIADIDIAARTLVGVRQVCALPRGIAFRATDDSLLVACMTGQLVTMAADPLAHTPLSTVNVHTATASVTDLRDVLVTQGSVYVTTFRSPSVVLVAPDGSVSDSYVLNTRVDTSAARLAAAGLPGTPQSFVPEVAFRAIVGPLGDIVIAHEGGSDRVINVSAADNGGTQIPIVTTCTQAEPGGQFCTQSCSSSEYDGTQCSTTCSSTPPVAPVCTSTPGAPICAPPILIGAVSSVSTSTGLTSDGPALPSGALPVDIVPTPDGTHYIVALAGNPGGSVGPDGTPNLNVMTVPAVSGNPAADAQAFDADLCGSAFAASGVSLPGQVTAVAVDAMGQTVAQTREPATLQIVGPSGTPSTIALSSVSVANEGFDLFHENTGRGMTCAGCHAEGQDDGRTWTFTDGFNADGTPVEAKPRRTQTFRAGFLETAPFHWDGEFAGMPALMTDVFVHRMAASTAPTPAQESAVELWMNGIPPKMHDAPSAALAAQINRGKAVFEDPTVGCTSCHSGSSFTNNQSTDIGFGYPLQVPTLIDVAFRGPFLHDGSVPTLMARFSDPTAKSGKHGTTSGLSTAALSDLVAYLESL
jgi:hypothetical protein